MNRTQQALLPPLGDDAAQAQSAHLTSEGASSRRRVLQAGLAAGVGLLLPSATSPRSAAAQGLLPLIADPLFTRPVADPRRLPKYVSPLPNPLAPGFLLAPNSGVFHISMRQISWQILPAGLPATRVWAYGDPTRPTTFSYPGHTIEARRGVPVRARYYHHELPNTHLLPVDRHLHGTHMGEPDVRTVVHLHGGHVEAGSDGYPEAWVSPSGAVGPFYRSGDFIYANDQEAATLWFHDHALGITRLNVYAGLAAFYILRDENEIALQNAGYLPRFPYEIPLAIQDRTFYPDGSLAYPDQPAPSLPGFSPWTGGPSINPEFFGNTMLVNGRTWPYLEVEPRKYRLRFLNGCNSRFLNMWFTSGGSTSLGSGPQIIQIGTDGGLLNAPVTLTQLTLGPAERADCIVDFSRYAGQTLLLRNNAKTPFPMGATVDPNTTGQIMQIRVKKTRDTRIPDTTIPPSLRPVHGPIARLSPNAPARQLLLFEGTDQYGRLQPLLGTAAGGALDWNAPVTENPALGAVEVWEVFNPTMDTHPVHLHLAQFQVQSRQKFSAAVNPTNGALSGVRLINGPRPPAANEAGWKDTALMNPGEVTRIIAKFDLPGRYVWHCHILEHEDHEMMRPLHVGRLR